MCRLLPVDGQRSLGVTGDVAFFGQAVEARQVLGRCISVANLAFEPCVTIAMPLPAVLGRAASLSETVGLTCWNSGDDHAAARVEPMRWGWSA
jgi:hypothetical protein